MDYSKKSKEELLAEINFLKKKEDNISLVLDNINEIMFHLSFDENNVKHFEYLSPHVEKVLGLTTQEYIDANNKDRILEYFHPDDIKKLVEESKKITPKQKEYSFTYRFFNKKLDKYIWIEETIVATYKKNGKKSAVFGTAKDVTEKIEREKQLDFILENIEECLYNVKFTPNGKILNFVSPHIKKITGLTVDEFHEEGQSGKLIDRIHPDDIDLINKNIDEGLYEKKLKKIKSIFRLKPKGSKKYIWIEENLSAIYDKQGNILETTTVLRDITDQKEFDDKIKISEKSYKELFDNSSELLYIQTKEGMFLDVNKTVLKTYGYNKSEIIGKFPDFLAAPNKNDIEKVVKKIDLAWKGKKQEFEFWAKKKDGTIFPKHVIVRKENYFGKEVIIAAARDITTQKVAEQHLKENEEKYRTIFSKNLAGVFITEKEKIIDCNNSFARIFGYKSRVELIGKSVHKLYFSKKERERYMKDLKQKKALTNYVIRHKNKKGEEIWISTNVTINKNGKIEGTLVGITEQIETENKLKQSQKNYKDLTENSPYGVFVHINGKIIYGNKQAYKIWRIDQKKKIELSLEDFILKEDKKIVEQRIKKVQLGKDVPFKEFKVKLPFKNENIYIEAKPMLFDYQGKKAIQVVFNDITLKKELSKEKLRATIAEESNKILQKEINEREKIEKQLIAAQKYTGSIINSSIDIICASDEKGKIIEFNAAAEHAFGYSEKEILKKGVQIIYADKKDYLKVSKHLKDTGNFIGEVKNKRKNGEIFTSFLSASVLYNQENEQIGTMGVSRDITELKEAEKQLIESEERYRDLFENATDLIQSVDKEGNIVYVNNAWKKAVGYTEKEIENKNIFEIIHPDCTDRCTQLFGDIIKSKPGEAHLVSFDLKTKEGVKITVEGNTSLRLKNGKPESTRSILRNVTGEIWEKTKQTVYNNVAKIITEKSNPEEIYEGVRQELGKVLNTDVFIISYLLEDDTLIFPYYHDGIKGKIEREERQRGNGINEYFLTRKKPQLLKRKELDKIIKKGGYKLYNKKCLSFIGVPLKIKNKTVGVLSVQSYTNENEFSEKSVEILDFVSGAIALAVQRIADENKIFEQSSRLKSIIENSTHLFWTYDLQKGITSFNKNFINYIEDAYDKKAEIKKDNNKKTRFSSKEAHDFWDDKYEKAYSGKPQYFISEKKDKKGNKIVKEVFLNPIYDHNNKVSEISGIAHDITEKTLSEQKLKESLLEKEVLLKEVHHRVKNNLQVISSILNLQSSYVKDINMLNLLKESQNRIKSMAFIHESLYQTNDFSKINFSEYITSLSKNLVHSYGVYDNLVDLKLSLEDVSLKLDLSIPCGLIVNELVSNSLKYAFVDGREGAIKISLFEKNDNVHLIVQDNGLGLPKNINYKETDSLGLQLVNTLVEQLNGTIDLDNKKGVKYTIIFKKEQ